MCNKCIYYFNNKCYSPDKDHKDTYTKMIEGNVLKILINKDNKIIVKFKVIDLKEAKNFIEIIKTLNNIDQKFEKVIIARKKENDSLILNYQDSIGYVVKQISKQNLFYN
jgi:hypothetical protein